MRARSLAVGVVSVTLACAAVAVAAAKRPEVSFTLPPTTDVAKATPFSYKASNLPVGAELVVQRQEGTAHAWRTVVRLGHTDTGQSALPALQLGVYAVRIAALARPGAVVALRARHIAVFGQVTFATLFGRPGAQNSAVVGFNGNVGAGTATTPTSTFPYAFGGVAGVGNPAVKVTNNHCRSAHFDFLPGFPNRGADAGFANSTGSITVVQQAMDPVTASAPYNSIGSLDVTLVPGQSWAMNSNAVLGGTAGDPFYIYVNGYASCDSGVPFSSR